MGVPVRCPKCTRQFTAPEETQGWTVPCPGCGASIAVPPAPPRAARAVAELLADEEKKARQAQPSTAVNERLVSALGIKQRVGTPAPPGAVAPMESPTAFRRQKGPLDWVVEFKLVWATILLSLIILAISLARGAMVGGALFGTIGLLIGIGAWRSQTLAIYHSKAALDWRVAEKWIGAALLVLLFLATTWGCGRWIYAFADAIVSDGFTQLRLKWLGIFSLIWLAVTAYCIWMVRLSQQYVFFKPAAWSYLGYWGLALVLVLYQSSHPQSFHFSPPGREQAPQMANGSRLPVEENVPAPWRGAGTTSLPARSRLSGPALPNEQPRGPARSIAGDAAKGAAADVFYQRLETDDANPFIGPPRRQSAIPWSAEIDSPSQPSAAAASFRVAIPIASRRNNVVLPSVARPVAAVSSSENGWEIWNLATGQSLGQLTGAGQLDKPFALSPDGKSLAGRNGESVEVWSIKTGKLALRAVVDKRLRDYFIDVTQGPELIIAGTTADTPYCRVWTIDTDSHSRKIELPPMCRVGTAAAVSPGGHFLAFAHEGKMWLVDLRSGRMSGRLTFSSSQDSPWEDHTSSVVFSSDGAKLAVVSAVHYADPRLVVWNMADGSQLTETALPKETAEHSFDPIPIQFSPDGKFLFVRGKAIVDCTTWESARLRLSSEQVPFFNLRAIGVADANRLVLCSDQMVTTWRIPRNEAGNIDATGLEVSKQDLPPGMFKEWHTGTGFAGHIGEERAGEVLERSSRDYRHATSLKALASDDDELAESLQWYAPGKRPVLGLRFGLGVQAPGRAGLSPLTQRELENTTGPVGDSLAKEIQQRLERGKYGAWPQTGEADVRELVPLGVGTRQELLASAKRAGLDVLVALELTQQISTATRKPDYILRGTVMDVSGQPAWVSTPLSSEKTLAAKTNGGDLVADFVAEVMKEIDSVFVLSPMPELTPENVKRRMAALTGKKPDDLLTALAEVRYYHAKKLLSDDETMLALQNWVDLDTAGALVSGDRKSRRAALDRWERTASP
jgi:hypothetical protein